MFPEITDLFLVALIMAGAAFVQSVSGFGMAIVAVALLPLVMGLKDAIALIAVFNLFVSTLTLFWNRSGFSWKVARPLVIGMMIGIPLGYYFLQSTDSTILIRMLGAVLILIAISDTILSRKSHLSLPNWSAWPLAIFGGVIGGAFNVGGPPIVAYAYSQNWSKTQIVATLQSVFLIAGLFRNGLMISHDLGTSDRNDWSWNLVFNLFAAIPLAIVAIWLGKKCLDRIPQSTLRATVFTFIFIMGAKYLFYP
ncbi:MAG: sulfite exporter TauE/SafE family protein [Verrucomicrobia bacterium]|nr:sulfite exporter TauE/SafE family protein [Verrucomicrobiota bacterium]